jgi:hypothetical protein
MHMRPRDLENVAQSGFVINLTASEAKTLIK